MLQIRVGTSTMTLMSAFGYRCTTLPTVSGAPTSAINAKLRPNDASAEYVDAIQWATKPALRKPTSSRREIGGRDRGGRRRRQEQRLDAEPPAERHRADVREDRRHETEPEREAEEHGARRRRPSRDVRKGLARSEQDFAELKYRQLCHWIVTVLYAASRL